jgi:hypothetical protein
MGRRIVADMDRVDGIYKEGRIILQNEVNWPEGVKVEVVCAADGDRTVAGEFCEDSSEGLARWVKWFDSLDPVFTGEELKAFETRLRESREEQKGLHSEWERQLGHLLK